MAIIIQAAMQAKPGQRDSMAIACQAAMAGSQAEPGCNTYRFTVDIADSNLFHIVEVWDDEPSLLAHFGGKSFQDFITAAGDLMESIDMTALQGALAAYVVPMPG